MPHQHEADDETEDADENVGQGQLIAGVRETVAAVKPVEHWRFLQPALPTQPQQFTSFVLHRRPHHNEYTCSN